MLFKKVSISSITSIPMLWFLFVSLTTATFDAPCRGTSTGVCKRIGPIKFSNIRKVQVDQNGKQTCVERCVLLPRRFLRKNWKCGKCQVTVVFDLDATELVVQSCTPTSVTIGGTEIDKLKPGMIIVYTNNNEICGNCSSLFRRINSIKDNASMGVKVLSTSVAKFNEILDSKSYDKSVKTKEVEKAFNCSDVARFSKSKEEIMNEDGTNEDTFLSQAVNPNDFASAATIGQCASNWNRVLSDGRCQYTDCYVGDTGDPEDCFECFKKNGCGNGCGAQGGLSFSGNLLLFDFTESCCDHDFCYSSVNSKRACDVQFLADMLYQCPFGVRLFHFIPGTIGSFLSNSCQISAKLIFAIVALGGGKGHDIANAAQLEWNEQDICVAKCPSTQQSGGQGGTTLIIDLLRTSGQFNLTYEMYDIPDQLTVFYENKTIYDTGGLVSGGVSTNVSFSGKETRIKVVVFAPLDSTGWDIFVGCPES